MANKLVVAPAPHVQTSQSTARIMRDVVIALMPALAVSAVVFGVDVLRVTALSVAACVLFEYLIQKFLVRGASTIGNWSAVVTGVLLAFNLPASIPWWIVLIGAFVFGVERALYAIIAVFLVTKVSDGLIEGLKFSKSVYIITDKPDRIASMIMNDLDRGVTGISAKGMYSGQEKLMLYCVLAKKQLAYLKEKIDEIDPQAFVIVGDVREVHGEGFIER